MAEKLVLDAWFDRWPHCRGLTDGRVTSDRVALVRRDLPFATAARMLMREQAFDLAECPIATLAIGAAHGVAYRGLPVFVIRDFHQRSTVVAANGPIRQPEDLAGQRIGVRSYGQTTGAWVRGLLAREHGVNPASITWVVTEDSHVAGFRDPSNVELTPKGTDLLALLLAGDIQALIGFKDHDWTKVRPLYADQERATADWYRRTGIYPVNHAIVLRHALVEAHPWLPAELVRMFDAAKLIAMEEGWGDTPTLVDGTPRDELIDLVGRDVLPNSYGRNRPAIDLMLDLCAEQGLTPRRLGFDEVFVPL